VLIGDVGLLLRAVRQDPPKPLISGARPACRIRGTSIGRRRARRGGFT
jgi:hypothetical protein